jgi:hypothetical protein
VSDHYCRPIRPKGGILAGASDADTIKTQEY